MIQNGQIETKEQVAKFKLHRWVHESVPSKLLKLPTVMPNSQNQHDQKLGIARSFHFNPVPSAPNNRYSGEVELLFGGAAIIRVHPPFMRLWDAKDDNHSLFDFSVSPLMFAADTDVINRRSAQNLYRSQNMAYQNLCGYYAWYRDKIIPNLSLIELGRLSKETLSKFDSFGISTVTY